MSVAFATRLGEEHMALVKELQTALQERYDRDGISIRVTQRVVIETALDTLQKRVNDWQRPRKRRPTE
jgi:hypothetical protein